MKLTVHSCMTSIYVTCQLLLCSCNHEAFHISMTGLLYLIYVFQKEMKVGGLLTSAGINIGLCVLFLSLYSILRKQPQNVKVYFGRRIAEEHNRLRDAFILERFVPSPSWIVKSLRCTEEEILATAGLDAVVFNRILVFRYLHFYFNMCFFSFWLLLKVAAVLLCYLNLSVCILVYKVCYVTLIMTSPLVMWLSNCIAFCL